MTESFTMAKLLCLLVLVAAAAPIAQAGYGNDDDETTTERPYTALDDINAYHQQLKEDIYQLEHKAIVLSKKECYAGVERFDICDPEKLNIFEFLICLMTPYTTYNYDPFRRAVRYPDDAFKDTPALLVGIRGVGSLLFGEVKVTSEEETNKGFDIVINGGYTAYPYSVTVQWIACPRKHPIYPTVREFVPRYNPAPYQPDPGYGKYPPPFKPHLPPPRNTYPPPNPSTYRPRPPVPNPYQPNP